MIHVLDKETLRDPAQSLQDLGSLLKDKVNNTPKYRLGPLRLSVASLTADPGFASLIPARSHTFMEIDHEIIPTFVLLLPH